MRKKISLSNRVTLVLTALIMTGAMSGMAYAKDRVFDRNHGRGEDRGEARETGGRSGDSDYAPRSAPPAPQSPPQARTPPPAPTTSEPPAPRQNFGGGRGRGESGDDNRENGYRGGRNTGGFTPPPAPPPAPTQSYDQGRLHKGGTTFNPPPTQNNDQGRDRGGRGGRQDDNGDRGGRDNNGGRGTGWGGGNDRNQDRGENHDRGQGRGGDHDRGRGYGYGDRQEGRGHGYGYGDRDNHSRGHYSHNRRSDWDHGSWGSYRPRVDYRRHSYFRSYSGVRVGFYFAPYYGYYRVPSSYYGHNYRRGDYLPSFFLSYRLDDPYEYGLPYPPYDCAYVWVGNSIVLVDLYNYEILEIYYNVY